MALQPVTSTNNAPHSVQPIPVVLNGRTLEPNRRIPLNLDWVEEIRVNTSAVERRAATHVTRRTVKKDRQAAWLLRAIACMDLTTLSGDDSAERVRRLCAKARNPLQRHLVEGLGIEELHLTVGAVCVYHAFVETAVKALEGTGIPVAAVSTGFPAGLSPLAERVRGDSPLRRSRRAGDRHRHHPRARLQRRVAGALRRSRRLQGRLRPRAHEGHPRHRRPADAAQRGARQLGRHDGRRGLHQDLHRQGSVNATLPVSLVMVRCIRDYAERTGMAVGFKPAGGIRTAKQALDWLALMKDELGRPWLEPSLFRFGASSMLADIERQLEHYLTGRYSATYRHPIA